MVPKDIPHVMNYLNDIILKVTDTGHKTERAEMHIRTDIYQISGSHDLKNWILRDAAHIKATVSSQTPQELPFLLSFLRLLNGLQNWTKVLIE